MKPIYNCPFCQSNDLMACTWQLDEGETKALECANCYAGAPLSAWQKLNGHTPKPAAYPDPTQGASKSFVKTFCLADFGAC